MRHDELKPTEHIPIAPAQGTFEDLQITRGEYSPRNFRITLPPSVRRVGFVELPYDEVIGALVTLKHWPIEWQPGGTGPHFP